MFQPRSLANLLLSVLPIVSPTKAHSPTPSCQLGPGEESHTVGGSQAGPIWQWQIYRSAPYNPPEFEISNTGEPLADGLLFLTPSNFRPINSVKEAAPVIVTDKGQLVWNGPIVNATNFRVANYQGLPILTYWSGLSTEGGNIGHGYGSVTFLDEAYNEILTVCPKLGLVVPDGTDYPCEADFHESFLTDRDTLLVSAYNATPADLSAIGGPKDGWIFDCLVVEIDLKTQDVLFRWSAIEHIPITETKQPLLGTGNKSVPLDYFHINSIMNIGDSFLVNSRHTWSAYLISAKGEVEWTFQGDTGGDFGPPPESARFKWQHDARPHHVSKSSINISYFNNDNSASDNGSHPSTGLDLELSLPPNKSKPPKLLRYLSDPAQVIYAESQGSTQFLPNGNALLDYGQIPVLKEYGPGPTGKVRWTARLGLDNRVQSYRGFKQEWHAKPSSSPSLVVKPGNVSDGCATGYVSWNGATDVTAWEIWEGPSKGQLSRVDRVGYRGFETKFVVMGNCAQAVALEDKQVTGKSNVACKDM